MYSLVHGVHGAPGNVGVPITPPLPSWAQALVLMYSVAQKVVSCLPLPMEQVECCLLSELKTETG